MKNKTSTATTTITIQINNNNNEYILFDDTYPLIIDNYKSD